MKSEVVERLAPVIESMFQTVITDTDGPNEAAIAVGILLQVVCDAAVAQGTELTPEGVLKHIRAAELRTSFSTGTLQ